MLLLRTGDKHNLDAVLVNTWDFSKTRGSWLHSPHRATTTAPSSSMQPPGSAPALCAGEGDTAPAKPWISARSTEALSAKLASVVFLMWFVALLMWTPLGIFSVSQARNWSCSSGDCKWGGHTQCSTLCTGRGCSPFPLASKQSLGGQRAKPDLDTNCPK